MTERGLRHRHEELDAVAVTVARRVHHGGTIHCVVAGASATEVVVALASTGLPVATVAPGGERAVPAARRAATPSDVLVLVGPDDDPVLREVARRTRAWGVHSVWFATGGARPPVGAADHLVGCTDLTDAASRAGRLAARTAALVAEAGPLIVSAEQDAGAVCVTCADEGLLAEVRAFDPATGLATACVEGRISQVDTTLVGDVDAHELLLVHAGTALTRLDAPPA